MANAEIALAPGYALNEYRIESTLGIGGFGLTYLATDCNLKLKVAIKEYMPSDLASRCDDQSIEPKSDESRDTFNWGLARFLDESRTLASFRHPNIVRVMRFFEANKTAYMVMEFVAGQSFTEWVKPRRPLAEKEVLSIINPLLDGLELIHQGGYLHRDIKPSNIFIREDSSPVLLDFGSARAVSANTELTAIVTPGYAPFEQSHSHGNQGPWSDLYAIGAVLYWIVTGQRPVEAAARVRRDVMAPASQIGDPSRYSAGLLQAIDWALKPDEEARPQSVAEFRRTLQQLMPAPDLRATVMNVHPHSQPPSHPPSQPPSQPPSHSMPPSTTLATTLVFDSDTLKKVAADLAAHIGPIASVVVKSAAKKNANLAQLAEAVSKEIADEKARAAFLKKYASAEKTSLVSDSTRLTSGDAATAKAAPVHFDAQALAKAELALARYIGGVARSVVSRAAMQARDVAELYLLLADSIENKDDKRVFIRKALSARDDHTERAPSPVSGPAELTRPAGSTVLAPVEPTPIPSSNQAYTQAAVMFADISGSTRLYEMAGDAIASAAIEQHLALLKRKTAGAGGRVIKTIGDEIMATFPSADSAAGAAVDMQCSIAQMPLVAGIKIGIRIGFNFGPVVERDGDVFGDAVNVAARLTSQAQKDQIITSFETVEALSPILKLACRRLYSIQVKGKEQEVELCQVAWQQSDDATTLVRTPASMQTRTARLRLRYHSQEIVLDHTRSSLSLGREKTVDLVVEDSKASRAHCKIERRMDKFVLADHSGNGTYVTVDGDREVVLKREEFTLRGHGWIALGQPRAATNELVEFFCES